MKKNGFFSFRTDQEDRKFIAELARLLVRNKADAVRYAIKKIVFETRYEQTMENQPDHEPSN
jgi:hypothetical protein